MLHPHFGTLHTKLLISLCITLILGLNAVYIDHLTHDHHAHRTHAHEHHTDQYLFQYYLKRIDSSCGGHHQIQYDDLHDHHNCELVNCVKNIVTTCMPTLSSQRFSAAFQAVIKPSTLLSLPEVVARAPPVLTAYFDTLTH